MPSHMNCCFNKCTNSSRSTQNLSFHKFPTNESLCKQWVELCQNDKVIQKFKNHGSSQVSKSFRICSEHFKREDYVLWTTKKKVLHKGSIPLGHSISPKTTHATIATWSEMITEDGESVANNASWSPQATQSFDITGQVPEQGK
ncbi:52 kDa repressor of the inhibitor of the protein kinase-like [Daktulosphaira vitifoliae]|uniref:52 kDa repressor of the inhibitor of the protein kinase-like n=1 Tax=Daktulosphaira vitifoliae TaxID=58002 RepID=UPI0021A99125|nr:52 kDa repressor of the inhibitor of the protein kinase-like [Daktulosphaira vitifoliae]XP_050548185.1 52 kDa repressor of the inhibitor of the protein kinase-like [Daktulosphaira vitifoliae]